MFNIRTTQPSVSMQAITGTVAPEVSPEKIVWEKIQFFSRRKITKRRNSVSLKFSIRPGEQCWIISTAGLTI